MNHVVCSILVECGYDTCEKQALEILTEMLQSCKNFNSKVPNLFLFKILIVYISFDILLFTFKRFFTLNRCFDSIDRCGKEDEYLLLL